jgi:hypothetical protein
VQSSQIALLSGIVNGYAPSGPVYRGDFSVGTAERVFKFPIESGTTSGTIHFFEYHPSNSTPHGTDRVIVDYSPDILQVPSTPPILTIQSGPMDTNAVTANFVAPSDGFLMIQNLQRGLNGGGYGILVDGRGTGYTLNLAAMPEFYLVNVAAGAHTLLLQQEDNLIIDNTGNRAAAVYFVPVPEPTAIEIALIAAFGGIIIRRRA